MKKVSLITDGSCLGNPGPGGWACLLRFGGSKKELFGYDPHTTNNRMELMAPIQGLLALKEPCEVEVTTDAEYLRQGITHLDRQLETPPLVEKEPSGSQCRISGWSLTSWWASTKPLDLDQGPRRPRRQQPLRLARPECRPHPNQFLWRHPARPSSPESRRRLRSAASAGRAVRSGTGPGRRERPRMTHPRSLSPSPRPSLSSTPAGKSPKVPPAAPVQRPVLAALALIAILSDYRIVTGALSNGITAGEFRRKPDRHHLRYPPVLRILAGS